MIATPRELRAAFERDPWTYSQAAQYVADMRKGIGAAWEWLTPRVREALVAEKAFAVCRGRASDTVSVRAMDRLLAAMRVAAGLAELSEVHP